MIPEPTIPTRLTAICAAPRPDGHQVTRPARRCELEVTHGSRSAQPASGLLVASAADGLPAVTAGSLALVGGGEWRDGCRDLDAELLAASGADEVVVLPTAAAFEHPERVGERADGVLRDARGDGAGRCRCCTGPRPRTRRSPRSCAAAKFVYLADGSPLHLRSVLKDSALFEAILAAYHGGGVLAASGAGATLLCDPMVDPRGGAYTVGPRRRAEPRGVPVPRHRGRPPPRALDRPAAGARRRSSASTRRPRSSRDPDGGWRVAGAGAVTALRRRSAHRAELRGRGTGRRSTRSTLAVASRRHDSVIVTFVIVTFVVGFAVAARGASRALIFCATSRPVVTVADGPYVSRQRRRVLGAGRWYDEELRPAVPGGSAPVLAIATEPTG